MQGKEDDKGKEATRDLRREGYVRPATHCFGRGG